MILLQKEKSKLKISKTVYHANKKDIFILLVTTFTLSKFLVYATHYLYFITSGRYTPCIVILENADDVEKIVVQYFLLFHCSFSHFINDLMVKYSAVFTVQSSAR